MLAFLPNDCLMLEEVFAELNRGSTSGRDGAASVRKMLNDGLLSVVPLVAEGYKVFEHLVDGGAIVTVDDGEAATIAHAVSVLGTAIIDEKKATELCRTSYPGLTVGTTVDIFSHPEVLSGLTLSELRHSVLSALRQARMSVLPHQLEWIVELIGEEEAARCGSLRKALRCRGGQSGLSCGDD